MKPLRVGELALGHTVNWLSVYGFDYMLYPFVIWKLGPLVGGGIMALASLVICLMTLWFYDWSKRDWLGIEAVKEMRGTVYVKGLRKLLARALQSGEHSCFPRAFALHRPIHHHRLHAQKCIQRHGARRLGDFPRELAHL